MTLRYLDSIQLQTQDLVNDKVLMTLAPTTSRSRTQQLATHDYLQYIFMYSHWK